MTIAFGIVTLFPFGQALFDATNFDLSSTYAHIALGRVHNARLNAKCEGNISESLEYKLETIESLQEFLLGLINTPTSVLILA